MDNPFDNISKYCIIAYAIVSFIKLTAGSMVETFFRWVFLGAVVDFVLTAYAGLSALLIVGILSKYIKDWRWLAGLGVLIFLFFQFGI